MPEPNAEGQLFRSLRVDQIDGSDEPLRHSLDEASLNELTRSVGAQGVLQPIRVRQRGHRYQVVAGHRRLAAARQAGLEEIPAVVVQVDDQRALLEALVENVQREDLNPVERGEALRRLRVNLRAPSWEEVGRRIGISRRHVYHLLNVAELPAAIRDDIQGGIVSEKHGRALLRLRNHPDLQIRLWRQLVAERVSGDEALYLARELVEEREDKARKPVPAAMPSQPASLGQAVDMLLRVLPRTSMREVRPLREPLETLTRCLEGLPAVGGGEAEAPDAPSQGR